MRCPNCGGYKRNPDEDLRRLEQAASSGDVYAARKLSLEKHRRRLCGDGEGCWQCQIKNLKSPYTEIKWRFGEKLAKIDDPASIPSLVKIIQDYVKNRGLGSSKEWHASYWASYWATYALREMGDPAAARELKILKESGQIS